MALVVDEAHCVKTRLVLFLSYMCMYHVSRGDEFRVAFALLGEL